MKYRVLFIACSGICLLGCLAFAALWVRSLRWMDVVTGPVTSRRGLALGTTPGRIVVALVDRQPGPDIFERWEWRIESTEVLQDIVRDRGLSGVRVNPRDVDNFFNIWMIGRGTPRSVPIWSLVLGSAMLGAVFSIRWSRRFSLLTLLIAMTIAGAVGGFVLWAK